MLVMFHRSTSPYFGVAVNDKPLAQEAPSIENINSRRPKGNYPRIVKNYLITSSTRTRKAAVL